MSCERLANQIIISN
uniref:Uncharacterized protein n=1 Tax=Arundo donax TaxID=35708 RepID=A0A0A8YQK1_ARUDO